MPVYNSEKYLSFSVGSVLAQTYDDWELICVDDGSTDASGKILDNYVVQDARIRVIHQANNGEGCARNAGLDVATGELIAFLDADDVFHPAALDLFAQTRAETSADVIRYCWRSVTTHETDFATVPKGAVGRLIDMSCRTDSMMEFLTLGAATVISRRVCGLERYSQLTQGADIIFVADCLAKTLNVAFIDIPILHYLTHAESISQRVSVKLLKGTCDYILPMIDCCAALERTPESKARTHRYFCELLFRRLLGSWKLLDDVGECRLVCETYWRTLATLVEKDGFFLPHERWWVAQAVRVQSECLLRFLSAIPYRRSWRMR